MSDDLTHSKLERGTKMTKRQNFKLDDERNNIDFSSWNFPKLEEMNEFIAKAFEELIIDTVACKARIDFQVLQYDNEETEEELKKLENINNILINLPFGDEVDGPVWSLNLIEEIEFQIESYEDIYLNPDDIKYGKIRLKVLSDIFKRCAQMVDESIAKEWDNE